MENTSDVFAHTLSFQKKKKNRNTIHKIVFPSYPSKNNFFYSWIHQKKEDSKQRETSLKRRIKKGELHKNEKPFFQETEKQNTEKRNWSEKGPKKKTRENWDFDGKEKMEKEFCRSLNFFFAQWVWYEETLGAYKDQKRKFKSQKQVKETRNKKRKKREQMERGWTKGGNKEVKKAF